MRSRVSFLVLFLLLLVGQALEERTSAQVARVSSAATAPLAARTAGLDTSLGDALRSLTARAGVVFAGQVIAVKRLGGVVEITFRVDEAVVGDVSASYTLREWGGLWTGGRERYRVGQRAMFFLHAAKATGGGRAGFGSPVDGMDGVVPLVPMGADAPALLDVRRLATRVLRAQGQPMQGDAIAMPDAVRVIAAARAVVPAGGEFEPVRLRLPQGVVPVESGVSDAR